MTDAHTRFALLADIHGNVLALEAVLADIQRRGGVDEIWVLGDLVALGPAPVETLERLAKLPHVHCVRGNTERYVCTGDRPPPSPAEVEADPSLLQVLVEVEGTFAWTQGAVSQAGWFEWLSALPLQRVATLPDGTRMLGVHAGPGRDDGIGFYPALNKAEMAYLLGDHDADLVCVGHTHTPLDVTVGSTRIVNAGSISNPLPPDLRASYVLLDADMNGFRATHHRVDYDREAVVAALERLRHPGASFIIRHLRGGGRPHSVRPALPQGPRDTLQ